MTARLVPAMLLLALLAGCGGGGQGVSSGGARFGYAPPGPPGDPWGPYITEASARFAVPDRWIRAVMHQESGGQEYLHGQPITSDAGATGLMQVMPQTYAELRAQYNLGDDPYNPHDNIIAGTGYIRQMYDRFGSPAFLAAYNAGPQRVADYMAGRGALPNETVNYLALISPHLGNDLPMSGPLAAYADTGGAPLTPDPVPQAYATRQIAGCWRDPDAAYDPDAPCRAAPRARVALQPPSKPRLVAQSASCWHDPDAAYDPDAPCRPAPAAAPVQLAEAAPPPHTTAPGQMLWGGQAGARTAPPPAQPAPHHNFASYLIPSAAASELPPRRVSGGWAIQVGAFTDPGQAREVANTARALAPGELRATQTVLGATSPFGGHVLYRARLTGLSAQTAALACDALAAHGQACVTVPPGG